MAKIKNLDADCYLIPLPVALSDSTHGILTAFELVTARLRDEDGAEGVGYTYTVGALGLSTAVAINRDLRPVLVGTDAELIEKRWQQMHWRLHYGGRGGPATLAISAVDIALWDLKAGRLGVPLYRLLGGHDPRVPIYAGGIDLKVPIDDLLRQTDENLTHGFRAIKMRVGRPRLGEDVARIRAMRQHLGDGFPLMVDANMCWSVDDGIRAARAFSEFDLYWLEEPIIPDDVAGHARIVRQGGVPIATGENFRSLYEFKAMIDAGGVNFPEPDVTNCGGINTFMKVAHLAEAYNLPVTSHGAHDLSVHLLAAVPNRSYLESHGFALDRFIGESLVIEDGLAIAPERPGHGIEFNWDALAPYRVA
jgi:L-alanine-DL-glutamate epimerase-like enolase superfamily enzyme